MDIKVQQSIGKFHKQMHIYDDLGGMKPALAVMRWTKYYHNQPIMIILKKK